MRRFHPTMSLHERMEEREASEGEKVGGKETRHDSQIPFRLDFVWKASRGKRTSTMIHNRKHREKNKKKKKTGGIANVAKDSSISFLTFLMDGRYVAKDRYK